MLSLFESEVLYEVIFIRASISSIFYCQREKFILWLGEPVEETFIWYFSCFVCKKGKV